MKLSMKSIAAALLTACSVAGAQVQTFTPGDEFNGLTASGSATLAFSTGLLEALDTGQIEITGFAPAVLEVQFTDGFYSSVTASAPGTGITLNTETLDVVGVATQGAPRSSPLPCGAFPRVDS